MIWAPAFMSWYEFFWRRRSLRVFRSGERNASLSVTTSGQREFSSGGEIRVFAWLRTVCESSGKPFFDRWSAYENSFTNPDLDHKKTRAHARVFLLLSYRKIISTNWQSYLAFFLLLPELVKDLLGYVHCAHRSWFSCAAQAPSDVAEE